MPRQRVGFFLALVTHQLAFPTHPTSQDVTGKLSPGVVKAGKVGAVRGSTATPTPSGKKMDSVAASLTNIVKEMSLIRQLQVPDPRHIDRSPFSSSSSFGRCSIACWLLRGIPVAAGLDNRDAPLQLRRFPS